MPPYRRHDQSCEPVRCSVGICPADLQSAYQLPSSTAGAGQVAAVIDAFDDPHSESDLGTYRAQFGQPACTTANGCFRKVNEFGAGSPLPAAYQGWAGEISLDLDMVSSACPNCHILLVEANSTSVRDLGTGVSHAVSLGARFVSNSYGGPEDPSDPTADSTYFDHPAVAITASAGDADYDGGEYPATPAYVTAVGGTSLVRAGSSRGWNGQLHQLNVGSTP